MDDKKAERPRNPNDTFQVGQPRPEIPRRTKGAPTNKLTTLDIHHGYIGGCQSRRLRWPRHRRIGRLLGKRGAETS